jgi:hypothetical protein
VKINEELTAELKELNKHVQTLIKLIKEKEAVEPVIKEQPEEDEIEIPESDVTAEEIRSIMADAVAQCGATKIKNVLQKVGEVSYFSECDPSKYPSLKAALNKEMKDDQ